MADGEKRIIELEELTALTDNDYIAVDNSASGGKTKKFKPKNLQDATNQVLEDVAYLTWENNHYYNRGDIVAYEGYLYVCKVDEATYGSFERSDWKKTYVERWGRDLFFDISSQEMLFSDSEYTMPYSKGDVVYRYYPHPSNDGFQMRFYVAKADYPNGVTEYVASQWDEYLSLSEVVDALNKETNKSVDEALAEGTASGSIASFTDGSTLPMRKLEVAIEPQQDLHGYENPWVGGSGKNKLDSAYFNGVSQYTVNSNQSVTVTANDTRNWSSVATYPMKSGTYVFSRSGTSGACAIRTSLDDYASDFATIASGNTSASFTLSSDCNIKIKLDYNSGSYPIIEKIQIESGNQATSYAPYSNICPISGWNEVNVGVSGVNVWDEEWVLDGNYRLSSKNYIPVKANTEYLFGNTLLYSITCYDINKNSLGGASLTQVPTIGYKFTTKPNTYYIKFNVGNSYGSTYNNDISINYPSTDTSYHAYNGSTYTIDLDGTRYGGTLDVVSGVLVVDRTYVKGGWTQYASSNGYKAYRKSTPNPKGSNLLCNPVSNMISEFGSFSSSNMDRNIVQLNYVSGETSTMAYMALQEDASVDDVEICYKLATTQTIQLTPTEVKSLLATNNVFADTGDILDATYVRNANITINDLIRRIETLENA